MSNERLRDRRIAYGESLEQYREAILQQNSGYLISDTGRYFVVKLPVKAQRLSPSRKIDKHFKTYDAAKQFRDSLPAMLLDRGVFRPHAFIDWRSRLNIPDASERVVQALHYYRKWLDQAEPDHHMYLRTETSGRTFVRLCVKRKSAGIYIQEQFACTYTRTEGEALAMARQQRAKIPSEVFFINKYGNISVPGVTQKADGKTHYVDFKFQGEVYRKWFSSRNYADPWLHAVKFMFDVKGVMYPASLFIE